MDDNGFPGDITTTSLTLLHLSFRIDFYIIQDTSCNGILKPCLFGDSATLWIVFQRFDPTLTANNSGLKPLNLKKYHIFGIVRMSAFTDESGGVGGVTCLPKLHRSSPELFFLIPKLLKFDDSFSDPILTLPTCSSPFSSSSLYTSSVGHPCKPNEKLRVNDKNIDSTSVKGTI